jgi:hypothetical protein
MAIGTKVALQKAIGKIGKLPLTLLRCEEILRKIIK